MYARERLKNVEVSGANANKRRELLLAAGICEAHRHVEEEALVAGSMVIMPAFRLTAPSDVCMDLRLRKVLIDACDQLRWTKSSFFCCLFFTYLVHSSRWCVVVGVLRCLLVCKVVRGVAIPSVEGLFFVEYLPIFILIRRIVKRLQDPRPELRIPQLVFG